MKTMSVCQMSVVDEIYCTAIHVSLLLHTLQHSTTAVDNGIPKNCMPLRNYISRKREVLTSRSCKMLVPTIT
jgi:hypothetical protein